jgi:hypothetical protein
MKRTFKRPDGTEETLEGTAEELAEYERKLNESERKAPKPGVLKGRELEAVPDQLRRLQEAIDRFSDRMPLYWPRPDNPIWIVSCSVCGRINCNGYHGFPAAPYCVRDVTAKMAEAISQLPSDTRVKLCHESVSS